jgi:chromosome partitioning protein
MKTKIISCASLKGGIGKTTTVASLGSILSKQGYRVLLVDLDAQANLTTSLTEEKVKETIYEAMTGKIEHLPVIELDDSLDLVPASLSLAMADVELSNVIAREKVLSELLEQDNISGKYDFVFLDCPPSLGLVTLNAFTASTDIIVPLIPEVLPFTGLSMVNQVIGMVRKRLNPQVHVSGILITRWENSKLYREIEEELRSKLGNLVYKTKIRKNVRIAEAPIKHRSIMDYDPRSNGSKDYKAFAQEFIGTLGISNVERK